MNRTLLEWGQMVRDGYILTEADIEAIIPNADRFNGDASWTEEKKAFHDHGFMKYVGNIGMLKPQRKVRPLTPMEMVVAKVSAEVGQKYAEEHASEKVTSKEVVTAALTNIAQGKGTYINGDTGVGKTHTLVEIMIHLTDFLGNTNDFRYYYYGDLFKLLQKNEKYQKAKIILLDDLCEPPASWFEGLLETFFEDVYRSGCQIIITSNIKLADYKVKRIASRLKALCQEYTIDGDDRRQPDWQTF